MRCPDCSKFVPFNTEVDPDAEEPEISGTTFSVAVRRMLECGECGTELKSADLEIELDLSESIDIECEKAEDKEHEWDFDIEYSPTERTEGKGRGLTTFYGVEAKGKATCGQEAAIEGSDEVQASAMDESV